MTKAESLCNQFESIRLSMIHYIEDIIEKNNGIVEFTQDYRTLPNVLFFEKGEHLYCTIVGMTRFGLGTKVVTVEKENGLQTLRYTNHMTSDDLMSVVRFLSENKY